MSDATMMTIWRTYTFEAAHFLPHAGDGHRCARVHGHNWRVELHVRGALNPERGWVIDYAALDEAVDAVIGALDHRTLNDVPGLENPTSESVVAYLLARLVVPVSALGVEIVRIAVSENERSGATWEVTR